MNDRIDLSSGVMGIGGAAQSAPTDHLRSPTAMLSRAFEIQRVCGGRPPRTQLAAPTPEARAAWAAYQCAWALTAARQHYGFLRQRRLSIRWLYHAYAEDRRLARASLAAAVTYLREAEGRLAVIEMRRAA